VVGSLADGASAAELAREVEPQVVLLDYRLPGLDSIDVARAVRGVRPETAIVCLTGEASEREIAELEAAGIAETLKKDEPLDAIVAALRRAARSV
jgi:DNA-binding NarL/FixJ family response regulator